MEILRLLAEPDPAKAIPSIDALADQWDLLTEVLPALDALKAAVYRLVVLAQEIAEEEDGLGPIVITKTQTPRPAGPTVRRIGPAGIIRGPRPKTPPAPPRGRLINQPPLELRPGERNAIRHAQKRIDGILAAAESQHAGELTEKQGRLLAEYETIIMDIEATAAERSQ